MQRLQGKARAGTPAQAAAFAQFIVLTTPWNAAEAAIRSMGDVNGKIILESAAPLSMVEPIAVVSLARKILYQISGSRSWRSATAR